MLTITSVVNLDNKLKPGLVDSHNIWPENETGLLWKEGSE